MFSTLSAHVYIKGISWRRECKKIFNVFELLCLMQWQRRVGLQVRDLYLLFKYLGSGSGRLVNGCAYPLLLYVFIPKGVVVISHYMSVLLLTL